MSVPPGTCQGCLSTGRYLYRLTQYYCLLKGLELFQFQNASETVKVCWECKAKLRNMSLFINQVKTAQSVLEETTVNNTDLKSLSSLSIVKSETDSYGGDENNEIFSKPVEVKLEKIVEDSAYKHETANDYSDNVDDDNFDDPTIDQTVKLEETQTEEPRKYLRTNKKAKVKNKFLKAKMKSHRPILKAIEIKELSFWLERERDSDFYKTSLFNCLNCFKRFRCMKQYKQHMDTAHKPSKFVCEVCTVGFDTEADLRNHVPKHYFIRECKTCQYQCYGRSNMRYHLRRHITKKEYQCDQCRLTFSFVIELKRHYNALHRRCVCDVCGKSVTTKLMMEKHFKNHHTLIKCKECNTTYKNQKNYNAHFNLRHVKFPADFQELCYCVQCDIKFDNNALYRRHLQSSRAHRERDKVPCPECDKVYSRKTFMMNHYRLIHLNKTNFYCKLCDKYLLNSTRYNYHMKYQHQKLEKEKNKLCSICGRGFNTNRTLANHILTHTGERPYPCDICGARFSQKQAMQSHVKHVHFNVSRRKSR